MSLREESVLKRLTEREKEGKLKVHAWTHTGASTALFSSYESRFYYIRRRIECFTGEINHRNDYTRGFHQRKYVGMVLILGRNIFLLCVDGISAEAPFQLEKRVFKMDLRECPEYTFYSGQIVGIEGRVTAASQIEVFSVIYEQQVNVPTEKVAPGTTPFTVKAYVLSRDKRNALSVVEEEKADLVILIGDISPEERSKCREAAKKRKVTTILLPEIGGIYSNMVFPSLFLEIDGNNGATSSASTSSSTPLTEIDIPFFYAELSNPCTISVNGVIIGISSYDALRSISSTEVSKGNPERMSNILTHYAVQGTFLPVHTSRVPVEYALESLLMWPMVPDLLLTWSCLEAPPKCVLGTHIVPIKGAFFSGRISPVIDSSPEAFTPRVTLNLIEPA